MHERDPDNPTPAPPASLDVADLHRLGVRPINGGLADPARWPSEPASPRRVDVARFGVALAALCPPWVDTDAAPEWASAITRWSRHFDVDPFLVGALVQQQSDCRPDRNDSWGIGLTAIAPSMYRAGLESGAYRFGLRGPAGFAAHHIDVSAFPFDAERLTTPEANVFFAAAFLSVWKQQCPDVDRLFDSASHRHFVSHFVFGDEVRETGPEDAILTSRRRLIEYYGAVRSPPRGEAFGLPLSSPLDGAPRLTTSGMGEPRDGGHRLHKGIDFLAVQGEPVRAVAAGVVEIAGVDRRDGTLVSVDPSAAPMIPERTMGPRGLFVRIRHAHGVSSLYSHLAAYKVRAGQHVAAGDLVGYVGRTGVRYSQPQLHFGLFHGEEAIDPLPHLAPYLFPPDALRRRHGRVNDPTAARSRGGVGSVSSTR